MSNNSDLKKIITDADESFSLRITSSKHAFDYNVSNVWMDRSSKIITVEVAPILDQKTNSSGTEL